MKATCTTTTANATGIFSCFCALLFFIILSFSNSSFAQSVQQTTKFRDGIQDISNSSLMGWIGLTVHDLSTGSEQECYIILNPEATFGYDQFLDGEYQIGNVPVFYSLAGGERLSTNSIPSLTSGNDINFVFVPESGLGFKIVASGLELIDSQVYLYDKIAKADLNLSQNPEYYFISQSDDDTSRFILHFGLTGTYNPAKSDNFFALYSDNTLKYNTMSHDDHLVLFNTQGQVLRNLKPEPGDFHTCNLQLAPGIYVLRLFTGNRSISRKFAVN